MVCEFQSDKPERSGCYQLQYSFRSEVTRVNRRRMRDDDVVITIHVRDQTGEETLVKIKKAEGYFAELFALSTGWREDLPMDNSLRLL